MGKQRRLEGTGQTYSHAERIHQLVAEIELADKVGLDVYGIGEHHRADFAVSAQRLSWQQVQSYQENPFDQCSQHSVKHGPDSFVPTVCHYDALSNGRAEIWLGEALLRSHFLCLAMI